MRSATRSTGQRVRAVGLAAALAASGCAVGPNYHRPATPPAERYTPTAWAAATAAAHSPGGAAQRLVMGQEIAAQWWTLFHSPALNALVEQAFRHSPTIDAAVAALREAQENVYAQRGYFFPTVQAGYSFERQRLAGNVASSAAPGLQGNGQDIVPPGPAEPVTYNFHTASVTVGYTPDVFGVNRRQVESLQAQADAARYQLQAAYVTLAANVVAAAIQEAATRAQLAAVQAIITDNQRSLQLLRAQFSLGAVMRLDVATQEAALAQAQQQLPPLQKQLEQTRDLLRVLVGNAPDHDVTAGFQLSDLQLPTQLPVSLPSQLIAQRPDVRAAEAQVHSASAQVGVALANRLPQFAISGALGGEATQFNQMFTPAGLFWSVVGDASATLFDGGTLRHRQNAAEQALVQATAQYRGTVLSAFQNVADTLHALYADADALQSAVSAEQTARITLDLTQQQLQAGYVNYLAVLSAEQGYQQATLTLVQAEASRFGDTAALFDALGGGWWASSAAATAGEEPPAGATR